MVHSLLRVNPNGSSFGACSLNRKPHEKKMVTSSEATKKNKIQWSGYGVRGGAKGARVPGI
jgi:hypothetical protein